MGRSIVRAIEVAIIFGLIMFAVQRKLFLIFGFSYRDVVFTRENLH